jgi:hypothetical protein
MNRITAERDALTATLTDMLGGIVQSVGIDPAEARPTTGHVAIVIEPPEVTYPTWRAIEIHWTLDLLAGTQTTQAASLDLLTDAIELLAEHGLNIERATPSRSTWPAPATSPPIRSNSTHSNYSTNNN